MPQRRSSVPLMFDVAHQQRAVEFQRAARKQLFVGKEARFDRFHGQWLDFPTKTPQFEAVELARILRHGIPQRALLENLDAASSDLKTDVAGNRSATCPLTHTRVPSRGLCILTWTCPFTSNESKRA